MKPDRTYVAQLGNRMIVRSLEAASTGTPPAAPFVTLFPAILFDDHAYATGLAPMLAQQGCEQFVVVGGLANELAEELDKVFGRTEILVTAFPELSAGADLFLVGAEASSGGLALCADHDDLARVVHERTKVMLWKLA